MTYRRCVFSVLVATFFISTMGLGIRLVEVATVWQILFYRFAALSILLFAGTAKERGGRPIRAMGAARRSGVVGGFALVLAFPGGIAALRLTSVANAMLPFATAPFVAAPMGLVVLRETSCRG